MAKNETNWQEVEDFSSIFQGGAVPPFPQSSDDLAALSETAQALVRQRLPLLWERLHAGGESRLPADVALRMHKGELIASDVDALRAAGLDGQALELEGQVREAQVAQFMENQQREMEALRERNEQQRAQAEFGRMESAALMNAGFRAAGNARRGR